MQAHALAAAEHIRAGKANNLFELIAADTSLQVTVSDLAALAQNSETQLAGAKAQVQAVVGKVNKIVSANKAAASYQPGAIL